MESTNYPMNMEGCNFCVKAENYHKVEETLRNCGFEPVTDDSGDIVDLEIENDELTASYRALQQIAPYVEDGSYIEMYGRDGEMGPEALWRWVFRHGECHEIDAVVTWPEIP